MNKLKVTMRKGSKTKIKKESPEVFVLPPNLLEKLGINLGNYGSAAGSSTNSQITDINESSKESEPRKNKYSLKKDCGSNIPTSVISSSLVIESSSIIETAELMKRSVFLSPTFVSNSSSVIQGEIEIVGNVASECVDVNDGLLNDEYCVENAEDVSMDMHREYVSIPNVQSPVNNSISGRNQESKQVDQMVNGNVAMHDLDDHETLLDDHVDEAYSSDCSSSNTGCTVKADLNKRNRNKIHIISEQIIFSPQLLKSKSTGSPQGNSLIHGPINTTLISHNNSSIQRDDLNMDLIPMLTGNIETDEINVVNKCDLNEQNFLKENEVSKENIEMLQNINNIDLCAVNSTESEFIITTKNQTNFQVNEALQMPQEQEFILEGDVSIDTAVVVPCHIDFVDESKIIMKEREDFSVDKNICPNEAFEGNADYAIKNKNSDSISTKPTTTNEDLSNIILVDQNNANTCITETEIQNSLSVNNNEKLKSKKVAITPENNNVELLSTVQNGEADLTENNKSISTTDNQLVYSEKWLSENELKNLGKCRRRSKSLPKNSDENKANSPKDTSQTSKYKQSKNNPLQETATTGHIVYFKHFKKQECEKTKLVEHEKNEIHGEKQGITSGSHEINRITQHQINKVVMHEDKVREIAKYLSEFANLKQRSHFMDKNKMVNNRSFTNNKNTTYSKSSIQGVEKPGGPEINMKNQNYPPTRTYERKGRHGCKTIIPSYTLNGPKTSTQSIDLTDCNTTDICNEMEVCLCHDFGRLMPYDNVNAYEHIHFWNNARLDCSPDIIFSIYSEDASLVAFDNYINNDVEVYSSEGCNVTPYKLCWNEIKLIGENVSHNTEKEQNVSSNASNVIKNDDERQEVEKEHVANNTMISVNTLQNCERIPKDEISLCAPTAGKSGQKRKRSTILVDDEPPAKNKKLGTPKPITKRNLCIEEQGEQHTLTNSVKNDNPSKNSAPHKTRECITVNKTINEPLESFDPPPTSTNEAKVPEKRPKTELSTYSENRSIVCGVCQLIVEGDWIEHIASKHDYLAWKLGEPCLDVDDEGAVRDHLNEITKVSGGLTCGKCGLTRKYVQAYLSHVRRCSGEKAERPSEVKSCEDSVEHSLKNEDSPVDEGLVICGVCEESMQDSEWGDHRASRHDYLARKRGEIPLDVRDEAAVKEHLYEITKAYGGLTCAKCGLTRKYVKAYLSHIRSCTGLSESQNDTAYNVSTEFVPKVESGIVSEPIDNNVVETNTGSVKCAVCEESVQDEEWDQHIASRHDYLAWQRGNTPLDINDEDAVRSHLYEITKACGGLTCAKCGLTRKYVKAYLSHIKNCSGLDESQNDSTYNVSSNEVKLVNKSNDTSIITKEAYANRLIKCAVCEESMEETEWNSHIASQHDYLAWKIGDTVLEVKDENVVKEHLQEITKACGGLTCAKCGLTRKHVKSYMNHIKTCDGSNKSQNDSNLSTETRTRKESAKQTGNDSVADIICKQENATQSGSPIKCGICEETVQEEDWYSHIGSKHDYLAWKFGESSLDINDETAVNDHLYAITNACGGLTCSKCGLTRKYVKSYMTHFKNCTRADDSQNTSAYNTSIEESRAEVVDFANSSTSGRKRRRRDSIVKCGVCSEDIHKTEWNSHIGSRHKYLAWKQGEESLDITDKEAVRKHLIRIKKDIGGLACAKCGKNLKTVKKYMIHLKSCEGTLSSSDLKDSTLNLVLEGQVQTPISPAEGAALIKCGVCGQYSANGDWMRHIATSHEYLAWKDGEPPLNVNDEQEVRVHLRNIILEIGTLTCPKCDLPRKSVKSFLHHLKNCEELKDDKDNGSKPAGPSIKEEAASFNCGVCNEVVISLHWAQHLSEKHDYLAWKDGDTPVNVDDEEEVHQHLFNFTKQFGSLHCKYCGKNRKYVKSFLEHIKYCKNGGVRIVERPNAVVDLDDSIVNFASGGVCAVCHKEVDAGKWIQHTQKEHNYLAWREGERPWNVDDFDDVNQYLYVICKRMDGLTCRKCGLVRKYVKSYMTHIKNCDVVDLNFDSSVAEGIGPLNTDEYQCAMCKELIKSKDWKTHAIEKHYNVTWIVGETPIDIKNVYAVERFLKEYKQVTGCLKCNACGTTRASFAGFYAHIIMCKKTEEEIDIYRSHCDICNNKYLCIYKNQHALMHRVQTLTTESKIKLIEEHAGEEERGTPGKRRAAVKARSVIENYSDSMSKHLHSCQSCGFGTDFEEELKSHKCQVSNEKDFSGDEDSAAEIGSSEDESEDSDVDSKISNEANDGEVEEDEEDDDFPLKRKRHKDTVYTKVTRIPFKVEDINTYLRKSDEDFCSTYFTDEVLFPLWQCQHEPDSESDLARYLPQLEHSCKLKFNSDWTTLKRFEATHNSHGTSIFVGASIVCIAWVPPRVKDMSDLVSNYLAIACHNGPDAPRYQVGETPKHENLIQIWDFNNFRDLPELVLGIAHDFGTVWSMDWCPSGARDEPADASTAGRLGLLATACSSGSVYIFAVPHPAIVVKNNQIVHKLKPVAELRMTMSTERKPYQATSVSWSKQKEHKLVLVGYADGSLAYYDLKTDSPLLSTVENNVQLFHPYYDERPLNTCITGTDLYPVSGDTVGSGCGAWTAATGAELAPLAGTGMPGRARLSIASLGVAFAPHAGSALLAGDDAMMHASISELVWVPPGRRIGGTRCAAGCARCGRVAASTPPTLRVMRMHPSYCDTKKQVIGILEMTNHAKKRRKVVNDELSMVIEPLTYDDAISKYGIEFTKIGKTDRAMQQQYSARPKTHCPERFPLADVESMAFCLSRRFHDKLAVATHSGILFLIATN